MNREEDAKREYKNVKGTETEKWKGMEFKISSLYGWDFSCNIHAVSANQK
jgi:hypothetical protein